MSANNEFPDFSHPNQRKRNRYWKWSDGGTLSEFDWEAHDKDIGDWFKRCMADFPEQRDSTFMEEDIWAYNQWFKKWFSQFRNKVIENEDICCL